MGCCFARGCSHRGKDSRLFRFLKSPIRRKKWINLVRRNDKSPKTSSQLCSCHFSNHDSKALPTIFGWNVKKRLTFSSPEKKTRTGKGTLGDQSETSGLLSSSSEQIQPSGNLADGISPDNSHSLHSPKQINSSVDLLHNSISIGPDKDLYILDSPEQTFNSVGTEHHVSGSLFADDECNTELTSHHIQSLMSEITLLRSEVHHLKKQLATVLPDVVNVSKVTVLQREVERLKAELVNRKDFSFSKVSHSPDLVSHYTGLPNRETFYAVLSLCYQVEVKYWQGWRVTKVDKETQLFLTLLKLRRNLTNLDLSVRFNISKSTVSNIFISWVLLSHHIFVKNIMSCVPSRQKNQAGLPECFSDYPYTRIVLDCAGVETDNPTLLSNQNKMYSHYKSRITSKGLVGIAPNGSVTFVSKMFPGSTSDKKIVVESGVLNCLSPGDAVMADKGFNIDDLMPDGVALNIPPFKETPQFTADQINQTYGIAKARTHAERAIARIKNF